MSRCLGSTSLMTRPPMLIVPEPMSSSPAIMRRRVDLPQPDGPTSTAKAPSGTSTLTFRITSVEPKDLWTLRISTLAMSGAFPIGGGIGDAGGREQAQSGVVAGIEVRRGGDVIDGAVR